MGRAILNYERALRYIPGDDDLRHNLQLANLRSSTGSIRRRGCSCGTGGTGSRRRSRCTAITWLAVSLVLCS